jgi:hypothetical protein
MAASITERLAILRVNLRVLSEPLEKRQARAIS